MKIFIINKGCPSYLRYVAEQAEIWNGKGSVYLVLDKEYEQLAKYNVILMSDYSTYADEFAKYYKRLFQEGENCTYDLIWFQRFMYVLEYLKSVDHRGDFWIVDSDVLIYSDLRNVKISEGTRFTRNMEQDPCFLWFKGPDILQEYCDYMLNYYRVRFDEVERYYIDNYVNGPMRGGICEMTFLKWFAELKGDECQDLSRDIDSWAFDRGINSGDGYRRNLLKAKKVYWDEGKPYGIRYGRKIYFHGLHCQGLFKALIPLYFSGKAARSDIAYGRKWLLRSYLEMAPKNIIKKILGRF